MAQDLFTVTFVVDPEERKNWVLPQDMKKIPSGPGNLLSTMSRRDWLMSEFRWFASRPEFSALEWMNRRGREPWSDGNHTWYCSEVAPRDLPASLRAIEAILRIADNGKIVNFPVESARLRLLIDEDSRKDPTDLQVRKDGDGDDPEYLVHALLGFRRLLKLAIANNLQIVHYMWTP